MSAGLDLIEWREKVLPPAYAALVALAEAEGFRFLPRLTAPGELPVEDPEATHVLVFLTRGGEIHGCGALTGDPYDPAPSTWRMRHLYVAPAFRRQGAARRLAEALIARCGACVTLLTLRAADVRAARFWEAMGFSPVAHANRTHERAFG